MKLLRDILKELIGMFLADAKLSGAILVLVGAIAILVDLIGVTPLIGGVGLIVGCLTILAVVTAVEAKPKDGR